MNLVKTLTATEVLETIAIQAKLTLPENSQGCLTLNWEEDGGVSIYFLEDKCADGPSN